MCHAPATNPHTVTHDDFCIRAAGRRLFSSDGRVTPRLASRRLSSSVDVISAHGDIDASNADTLTEYTLRHLMRCRGLILDLHGLDFFGTEGFSALHRVSVCCAGRRHRLGSSAR